MIPRRSAQPTTPAPAAEQPVGASPTVHHAVDRSLLLTTGDRLVFTTVDDDGEWLDLPDRFVFSASYERTEIMKAAVAVLRVQTRTFETPAEPFTPTLPE